MTDNSKDAERLAEIRATSTYRERELFTVLASRDATIADQEWVLARISKQRDDLERQLGALRARFLVPPECDANCTISDCPYIHQWTERESPEVADLKRRLAEARALDEAVIEAARDWHEEVWERHNHFRLTNKELALIDALTARDTTLKE